MNRSQPSATVSRRATAQERLLRGVTEAADQYGFARLSVEKILAAAGVSRATFYNYYSSAEDCFRGAYRHHAEQLTREAAAAVRKGGDPERAALDAIAAFASSRPAVARLLTREALAAGPAGLIEREQLITELVHATSGASNRRSTVDLPPDVLIGGTFRFLAMRLSEASVPGTLARELREWAGAFPASPSGPSWSERLSPAFPEHSPRLVLRGFRPRGSVRERIIRATALAIRAKGYQALTVNDIVTAAGLSRRSFYNEFASKEHAFIAAYELMFQWVIGASTPAFFAERDWRERVWHAALAFTGFVAREPLLAYLGLVECYAVGPEFTLRVHDTQLAFTLFLEDGYKQGTHAASLPRAFSALVATTIFEVAFQASRLGPRFDMRRCQPLAVYIALAPFIGPDEAGEFVIDKLSKGRGRDSAIA